MEEVPIWKLKKVYKRAKSIEWVCCLMIKLHKHPKVYASFCTKNCCLDKLCEWHRTNTCLGCSFKLSSVSYKLFLFLDFKYLKFGINPPWSNWRNKEVLDKVGIMDKQYGFPTRVENFSMVQGCWLSGLDLPPSTMNNDSGEGVQTQFFSHQFMMSRTITTHAPHYPRLRVYLPPPLNVSPCSK